jgi:hypothetical protein
MYQNNNDVKTNNDIDNNSQIRQTNNSPTTSNVRINYFYYYQYITSNRLGQIILQLILFFA